MCKPILISHNKINKSVHVNVNETESSSTESTPKCTFEKHISFTSSTVIYFEKTTGHQKFTFL